MPQFESLTGKILKAENIGALKESFKIEKFKKTVLTVIASIFGNLCKYFNRKKPDRTQLLRQKGIKKFMNAVDVVTLVRTQARLKSLEFHLFSKQQIQLHRLNRFNFLEETSKSSSGSDKSKIDLLLDYEIKSKIDLKLLRGAFNSTEDD